MPQDAICHSQSAFPSRGATLGAESITEGMDDFYSHAPRGARPGRLLGNFVYLPISTHTPLAGRDEEMANAINNTPISTHTPLAGRDGMTALLFQLHSHFYSHAPRGARL